MTPGLYVVRDPKSSPARNRESWIVESRCFAFEPGIRPEWWTRKQADNWRDFIASQHVKDDVFVVEVQRVAAD